ncbi:MAG: hypothetical protein ACE5L7_04200, partial [Candidatus Aminicenantales bacterium]
SVKEIVAKNIQAAGGKEKLAETRYLTFKAGTRTYTISSDGDMKITEGKDPVVTEVILVDEEKARRNCFNTLSEYKGMERLNYIVLAKLFSGLFTLSPFESRLHLQGLRSFGPKNHYLLTSRVNGFELDFYLDTEGFHLQRLVMKGYDPEGNKYEVSYDFGPYQDVDGIKIPSSWFFSRVGARGQLIQISDVKRNPPLPEDFFSSLELNVGEVKISDKALKGNIVEFSFQRGMLLIGTNWTRDCIQKAGFQSRDKLLFKVTDRELEIDFYDTSPPRGAIGPGAKFMMRSRRGENYLIYLWSEGFKDLTESLEPLMPIQVRKSDKEDVNG